MDANPENNLPILLKKKKKVCCLIVSGKSIFDIFSDALDICSQSATQWITFPKVCWLLPLICNELETQRQISNDPLKKLLIAQWVFRVEQIKKDLGYFMGFFFCISKLQCDLSFTITAGIHKVPAGPSSLEVEAHSTSSNKITVKIKTIGTPQLRTFTPDQQLQIHRPHG